MRWGRSLGFPQHGLEGAGAGREDDLVSLQALAIRAAQRDVKEFTFLFQITKGARDICLEVVPTEAYMITRGTHIVRVLLIRNSCDGHTLI